jgi:hypothetical protein
MRERETLGARSTLSTKLTSYGKSRSTQMIDAHAELSVLIAARPEESRMKVMAFFDRKIVRALELPERPQGWPPGIR